MNKCAYFPSFVQIKLRRRGGESDKIERKCKAEAQMGEKNGKTEGCGAAAVDLSACFILAGFGSVLFGFGLFLLCAPTLVTDE